MVAKGTMRLAVGASTGCLFSASYEAVAVVVASLVVVPSAC